MADASRELERGYDKKLRKFEKSVQNVIDVSQRRLKSQEGALEESRREMEVLKEQFANRENNLRRELQLVIDRNSHHRHSLLEVMFCLHSLSLSFSLFLSIICLPFIFN